MPHWRNIFVIYLIQFHDCKMDPSSNSGDILPQFMILTRSNKASPYSASIQCSHDSLFWQFHK